MANKILTAMANAAAGVGLVPVQNGQLPRNRQFLGSESADHKAWYGHWRRLERAMKGGVHILPLLRRYDWETENGDSIASRKAWATYVNFPDLFLGSVTGVMAPKLPEPDKGLSFGTLGKVSVEREVAGYTPTNADLLYYNCDGIGNDGAQWNAWWLRRAKRALGLGHVWIMEESAHSVPDNPTFQDVLNGQRPYLVEFGPDRVWDHHIEQGVLQYAIIRIPYRRPRLTVSGAFESSVETHYYVHTRRGWDGFGDEYKGGGFWRYDSRGELFNNVRGNYDSLGGDIPLHVFFGERDDEGGSQDLPSISRPNVMELTALAIGYMNLASAADFEAWDSAKGIEYFIGCHQDAFNVAMDKINKGARYIPVATSEGAQDPRVQASNMGTVPAEVFERRFVAKRDEANLYGMLESSSTPDASGLSKKAGFAETKAPRIALFASEIETAQNTAIHNLELRWGEVTRVGEGKPLGFVKIPREYDLLDVEEALVKAFELSVNAGIESRTFKSKGFRSVLTSSGAFNNKTDLDKIEQEVADSVQTNIDAKARLSEFQAAALTATNRTPPPSGGGGGAPAGQ